nr:LTA synthase family protein [Ventosimonas gracilis]
MALTLCSFLLLLSLLRGLLLWFNQDLIGAATANDLIQAFVNGLRFDLRLCVYIALPLSLSILCRPLMLRRGWQLIWLGFCAVSVILLGMIELNFYQEFHQRLNALVFQYLQEDPKTVLSMLWHGFPVVKLLLALALISAIVIFLLRRADKASRPISSENNASRPALLLQHSLVFVLCVVLSVLAARGTLRQGPPLRWGDAFTSESVFANHLGLNGALSLWTAAKARYLDDNKRHRPAMPQQQATALTRQMLLSAQDELIDQDSAVVRRVFTPPADGRLAVKNVVVILMESFAAHFVGALGSDAGITPEFDKLAKEGLLFTNFFSNGTHTHQGLFASMACFPNLPGFEYLMQMPEGSHHFSGLPQLLSPRGYEDFYVYNGDFAWDNQQGFFRNQGMSRFIGRYDFKNPVVFDPTWGVADQDMFDRGAEEIARQKPPFYALLQTLSNHTPYPLPDPLPVDKITDKGSLNDHLTAMRYADWALGQFFEKVRKLPQFNQTLFVLLGDHGFAAHEQLTEMDLFRHHIAMLMIAPGIQQRFGKTIDTVGSQVDMVPTIMGRLGQPVTHQCWGRDLLSLPAEDQGFAVIKPSGSDQTVALIKGKQMLVQPVDEAPRGYQIELGAHPQANKAELPNEWRDQLAAYLQSATQSLLENTTGAQKSSAAE